MEQFREVLSTHFTTREINELFASMETVPDYMYSDSCSLADVLFEILRCSIQPVTNLEKSITEDNKGAKAKRSNNSRMALRKNIQLLKECVEENDISKLPNPFKHTQKLYPSSDVFSFQNELDQLAKTNIETVLAGIDNPDHIQLSVRVVCRVCKYEKANQVARQRRSGDEGMDVFHVCPQCKADYRI